jgi:DNA-binding response OmpR family regulator
VPLTRRAARRRGFAGRAVARSERDALMGRLFGLAALGDPGAGTERPTAREAGGPGRGPARVLLVLDQEVLAAVVELALAHVRGQFRVRVAPTVAAATELLGDWRPHLAVVDMDLAGGEMLARLGATAPLGTARVPVVALTRRGDLQATLAAFAQGVDDVLLVPFAPEELVVRVLAILRRTAPAGIALRPVLRLGDLEIDLLHRRVRVAGATLPLTPGEQSLLYLLAANAGRVLPREEILAYLWGADAATGSNVVARHVRNLRIKLRDDWRRPRYIATVPGRGYRFLPTDGGGAAPPADPPPAAR